MKTMINLNDSAKQNTTAASTAAAVTEADDIPREDLLHLTMKLSKRLKTQEAQAAKIKAAFKKSSAFVNGVRNWVKHDVLECVEPAPSDLLDELAGWQKSWSTQEQSRRDQMEAYRGEVNKLEDDKDQAIVDLSSAHRRELLGLTSQLKHEAAQLVQEVDQGQYATLPSSVTQRASAPPDKEPAEEDTPLSVNGDALNGSPKSSPEDSEEIAPPPILNTVNYDNSVLGAQVLTLQSKCDSLQAELRRQERELSQARMVLSREQKKLSEKEEALGACQNRLDDALEAAASAEHARRELGVQHEERMVYLQLQLKNGKEDSSKLVSNHVAKLSDKESELAAQMALTIEKENIIKRHQAEINELRRSIPEEMVRYKAQMDAEESRLTGKEAEQLRSEVASNRALVARMRIEAEAADKAHATRTALVGTLQAQITALEEPMKELQEEIASAREAEKCAKEEKQKMGEKLKLEGDRAVRLKAQAQLEVAALRDAHSSEMVRQIAKQDAEVLKLREDHKGKSSLARQLVTEKEATIEILTKEVEELRSEVETGGHSERKIMELAKAQAVRETDRDIQANEDRRELERVTRELKEKESSLLSANRAVSDIRSEASDLRRVSKREGVNMEYLKNIMVQYLSLRDTAQKQTLERVVGTLLQFSPKESKQIEQARSAFWISYWTGPKQIQPPSNGVYMGGSSVPTSLPPTP